jgi:hypothetical protein
MMSEKRMRRAAKMMQNLVTGCLNEKKGLIFSANGIAS